MAARNMARPKAWLGALICLCLGLMLLAGCGAGTMARNSGFLAHNDQLKQDPNDSSVWYWAKEGVDWSKYDKLLLDRLRCASIWRNQTGCSTRWRPASWPRNSGP